MNKLSTDILDEKVELIYEYDSRSPIFTRVANSEIERNNLELAIDILNKGLELYPNHPTAFMVLGKAFLLKGDYENSNECFKTGSELLHSPRSYNYYLKDLETIKKQRTPVRNLNIQDFVKDMVQNNPDFAGADDDSGFDGSTTMPGEDSPIENRLDEIARNLSSIQIERKTLLEDEHAGSDEDKDTRIIPSETLAQIYVAQGQYKNAMDVYQHLIKTEPAKKLFYTYKIKAIQDQLDLNHL